MAMTKRELIEFLNELVELASEENRARAVMVKRKMIDDFEKNYGFEKEAERQISYLPRHDIAAMPDDVQEEFKQKVMVELMKHRECTPWNVQRAMASKIYDLSDLIDIREHMERIEEENRKKAEQSRRGVR